MSTKGPSETILAAILVCFFGLHLVVAQGTFQNLNFESANVPPVPAGQYGDNVAVSDGVPGWTVYVAGIPQITVLHNNMSLGSAVVAIYGPSWYPHQILQGNYTVSLQGSSAGQPITLPAIGQTGLIPLTAESLRFYGQGDFAVTFGGQPLTFATLGSGANYTVYGADISSFAGQTGQLLFQGGGLLDFIQFSPQAVPEPGVTALATLGALLLGLAYARRALRFQSPSRITTHFQAVGDPL
jgi:hypothetical protein